MMSGRWAAICVRKRAPPPAHQRPPCPPGGSSASDQVRHVIGALRAAYPYPTIRAIVGIGSAAAACLTYAAKQPNATTDGSGGRLILLGADHTAPAEPRHVPMSLPSLTRQKRLAVPPAGWKILSVQGTNDDADKVAAALLFHLRHKDVGHALRLIAGGGATFERRVGHVVGALNDWLLGTRRLDSSDRGGWSAHALDAGSLN